MSCLDSTSRGIVGMCKYFVQFLRNKWLRLTLCRLLSVVVVERPLYRLNTWVRTLPTNSISFTSPIFTPPIVGQLWWSTSLLLALVIDTGTDGEYTIETSCPAGDEIIELRVLLGTRYRKVWPRSSDAYIRMTRHFAAHEVFCNMCARSDMACKICWDEIIPATNIMYESPHLSVAQHWQFLPNIAT